MLSSGRGDWFVEKVVNREPDNTLENYLKAMKGVLTDYRPSFLAFLFSAVFKHSRRYSSILSTNMTVSTSIKLAIATSRQR